MIDNFSFIDDYLLIKIKYQNKWILNLEIAINEWNNFTHKTQSQKTNNFSNIINGYLNSINKQNYF